MFTLLRNYRTMFMLTVSHNLEQAVDAFDTTDDDMLDATETQTLLESREAKNIVDLAEVDTLEAAAELSSTINFSDRLSSLEQKTIQYLATKIQKLNGGDIKDGSIDGNIGGGSRADISAASGIDVSGDDNSKLNQVVLDALTSKANDLVTTKRAEFALAAQEAADKRNSAISLVSQYSTVEQIKALDEDGRKAVQEALKILGHYTKAIDGDFGRGSIAAYNAAQVEIQAINFDAAEAVAATADENLRVATQVRDAEQSTELPEVLTANNGLQGRVLDAKVRLAQTAADAAEENLEEIQQDIADQADVYSRLEMGETPTAAELKDLLKQDPEGKMLLCQLQADMKLLKDQDGNVLYTGAIDGHNGVDRAFGPGTAGAVTKALEMYGSITAIRRAARIAEVSRESEINTGTGRTNQGIDLVAQTEGYEAGALEAFLAEAKCPDNMPEEIKEGTPEMQQAWIIGQAIEMGDRENADKTRLTLIDGLSQAGNDRIIDVMKELRANFETIEGQAEIIQAMSNGVDLSAADFANGEVGSESYQALELGGRIIDAGLLDSAYIATGSDQIRDHDGARMRGTMEVPIWNADGSINEKFAELDFANATYINGAIVMTVKNGCEGNLVIIPVQREKYVPPVVSPRAPRVPRTPSTPATPGTPEIIIVTEDTPTTGVRRECGKGIYQGDWIATPWTHTPTPGWGVFNDYTDGTPTVLIPDASQCNGGGGGNPSPTGDVSTDPGVEGGGDEGGGGEGGGNDAGR